MARKFNLDWLQSLNKKNVFYILNMICQRYFITVLLHLVLNTF